MKIIITEEQKKKLFIPRKLSSDDSRYSDWNNSQPIKDGVRINQYDPEGRKTGYWEEYWDNGALDRKGSYINGLMDGMWEIYYIDGELYSRGSYKDGERNGEWFYYNYDGKLEYKTLYKNGDKIKNLRIDESEDKKKLFIPRKLSDEDSRYSEWNKQQPNIVIDNQIVNLNQYSLDGKKIGIWVENPILIKKNYDKTKLDMETIFNNLKLVKPNNIYNNYYYQNKFIFQINRDKIITFFDLYFWREFKNKHSLKYKNYSDIGDLIRLWIEIKNRPITESKKLFIPRKLSDNDSRYTELNNNQPIVDGKRINQYDSEGRRQGYWEYYQDGKLYSKGNYINGEREGYWETYHSNGQLEGKGNYVNNKKDGMWEYYWSNGNLWEKSSFIDGKLDGVAEYYNLNGSLNRRELFKNGKLAKDIPLTESKKLFIPRKLSQDDSRYSEWNNNQPVIDGIKINQYDPEGRKQGMWMTYFRDGRLNSKGTYKDNEKDGLWEEYWGSSGKLMVKGYYINGKEDGLWEDYWKNGNLENKGQYINGKMEGMWESYWSNGNPHSKGKYINDNKYGIWEYYFDDGSLEKKILYNNGRIKDIPLTESKKLFIPRKLSGEDNRYTEWNTQQPTITLDNHTLKLNQYSLDGNQIGVWLDKPELINHNYIKTKPFMGELFNNLKVVKSTKGRNTNYKLNDKIIFQDRGNGVLTYFHNDFWKGFREKYNIFTYGNRDLIRVWMEIKYNLGHLYPNQVV